MCDILPASVYNSLPDGNALQPISSEHLARLGEILVHYDLQHQLGISLLHRHFSLARGEVMVHEGLSCAPRLADSLASLNGSSFYLQKGQFKAFEYDMTGSVPMPGPFVDDMAAFLDRCYLTKKVALTKLDHNHELLEETMDVKLRAHICTEIVGPVAPDAFGVTVWRFATSDSGHVQPIVARMCKQSSTNAHKRTM